MRSVQMLSLAAAVPLFFSCANSSPADPEANTASATASKQGAQREYRFRYEVTIPPQPDAEVVDVWLPLPKEDPGVQEVLALDIEAPQHRVTEEPVYGNRMVHVQLQKPSSPVKLAWTARVRRTEDTGQGTLPMRERYLAANRLIPIDGPALDLAQRLGVTSTELALRERAKRIYDDVLGDMKYDKAHEGWGLGSFEHATTVCMGNCTDFHSRFIGVARSAGIPVRFTMGIPMKPVAKGSYNSYHCWAHYYDGKNWHPVDISEADKVVDTDPAKAEWFFGHLDPDRISLTFGRDLWLEPRQNGGPLNYFVFPYAEADGEEVALGKKDWVFTYENL